MPRSSVLSLVLATLLTATAVAQPRDEVAARSFVDSALPELQVEDGTWINGPQTTTLASLRGGPLLIVYTSVW